MSQDYTADMLRFELKVAQEAIRRLEGQVREGQLQRKQLVAQLESVQDILKGATTMVSTAAKDVDGFLHAARVK